MTARTTVKVSYSVIDYRSYGLPFIAPSSGGAYAKSFSKDMQPISLSVGVDFKKCSSVIGSFDSVTDKDSVD